MIILFLLFLVFLINSFLLIIFCIFFLRFNIVFAKGSILGPLFFLVYINYLVLNLECDVHLFADDTSLLDCFDDSAESNGIICRDLEKNIRWSVLWKVTFNANKTRYMIITRKNNYLNYPPIYLHNTSIERTDQYTHLGLVVVY